MLNIQTVILWISWPCMIRVKDDQTSTGGSSRVITPGHEVCGATEVRAGTWGLEGLPWQQPCRQRPLELMY